MIKILIILFTSFYIISCAESAQIYQVEMELDSAINNPENDIYIDETNTPIKFKIRDLILNEKLTKEISKSTDSFNNDQFGIASEYESDYEKAEAYTEINSILKFYSVRIGDISIQAQLDIEKKQIHEIQFRTHENENDILFFLRFDTHKDELVEYLVSETRPYRSGWESVSHEQVSVKKYMFTVEKMDKNGSDEDKKNARNRALKIEQILISLMNEHHKCETKEFHMKVNKDSLKTTLNYSMKKFIDTKKSSNIYDDYLKKLSNNKIVFLYKKFHDGHGIYSRVFTFEGSHNYISVDLELIIKNIMDRDVYINYTQWKYCLPAKFTKTILITFEKGKISKIDY